MQKLVQIAFLVILGLFLAGCILEDNSKSSNFQIYEITTSEFSHSFGNFSLSAIICKPKNANASTPAIVLTGGDGVSAKMLKPACQEFAKRGFVALAHDNINSSLAANIQLISSFAKLLRNDSPTRPIALWGHSAGTIFSAFAAYEPSIKPFAFIETSGHMQIPICDSPKGSSFGMQCFEYWSNFPAPIMIVHGKNDSVVDPSFATDFSYRLSSIGRYHKILLVPNAGHEFMTDRIEVIEEEVEFLRQSMSEYS
jgi:dienelactone hydrolase